MLCPLGIYLQNNINTLAELFLYLLPKSAVIVTVNAGPFQESVLLNKFPKAFFRRKVIALPLSFPRPGRAGRNRNRTIQVRVLPAKIPADSSFTGTRRA
jgi:hypothetical protein